jgi:hypothetical protein
MIIARSFYWRLAGCVPQTQEGLLFRFGSYLRPGDEVEAEEQEQDTGTVMVIITMARNNKRIRCMPWSLVPLLVWKAVTDSLCSSKDCFDIVLILLAMSVLS